MLPTKRVLSQLLASLYDAAANPNMWEVFLRDLARTSRGNSVALIMHDFSDNKHNVAQQFGLDPDLLIKSYTSRNEINDIWVERARSVSQTGWLGVSEQLTGTRELFGSDFFNECLHPLNIRYGLFGVIEQSGAMLANVSLYRTSRGHAFGLSELELIEFFIPHLRRALQLHLRLTDLQSQNASFEAAIEMIGSGILLFNVAGKIIFANRVASELLMQRDGLIAKQNQLRARHSDESATLEQLIRTATTASIGNGVECGGAVLVSRKLRQPLRILVTPLRSLKTDAPEAAAAIAFIIDPSQRARPRNEILNALFGLTPAECRVALLLGDGKSISEVSGVLHVSKNTLKSQIASVYTKTGVARQSQLVRLLLQLPPEMSGSTKNENSRINNG